jgi:hypothetical protein
LSSIRDAAFSFIIWHVWIILAEFWYVNVPDVFVIVRLACFAQVSYAAITLRVFSALNSSSVSQIAPAALPPAPFSLATGPIAALSAVMSNVCSLDNLGDKSRHLPHHHTPKYHRHNLIHSSSSNFD